MVVWWNYTLEYQIPPPPILKNKGMTQYINKGALVAEIKRRLKNVNLNYVCAGSHPSATNTNKKLQDGISKNLQSLLSFINSLEVKEVDLKKELRDFVVRDIDDYDMGLAKHFFELGLKAAQNEHKSCTTDE